MSAVRLYGRPSVEAVVSVSRDSQLDRLHDAECIIRWVATRNQVHVRNRELDWGPGCLQLIHQTIPICSPPDLADAELRNKAADLRLEVLFVRYSGPQGSVQIEQRFGWLWLEPDGVVALAVAEGLESRQGDVDWLQILAVGCDLVGRLCKR